MMLRLSCHFLPAARVQPPRPAARRTALAAAALASLASFGSAVSDFSAQGDPSDFIYMVGEGRFEVVRDTPDGQTHLGYIEKGEHVGEMGPLFGLRRSATVRALEPCQVTGYTSKAFRDLVGAENLPKLIRGRR